jgi:N-acetylglutamate synthase-like GNAT family acetyltransferase
MYAQFDMKMWKRCIIFLFIIIIIIIIVSGASLHPVHHNANIKYFNKKVLNQHDCNLISTQLKKWENDNDMRYLNNPDNTHFFITDDAILISYLHVTKQDDAKHYINYVYTNENYRNKGYMKKLLSYTLNICKLHNVNTVYSWTTIDNVKSQNLFLSNNFDIVNIEHSHVITFMKHLV